MELIQFKELLKSAGLNKKQFAALINMQYNTVNAWGSNNAIPVWVESWLMLYIENKECKELKRIIKESICK
jgi:DNA-binding transcriptional regulator YiaG